MPAVGCNSVRKVPFPALLARLCPPIRCPFTSQNNIVNPRHANCHVYKDCQHQCLQVLKIWDLTHGTAQCRQVCRHAAPAAADDGAAGVTRLQWRRPRRPAPSTCGTPGPAPSCSGSRRDRPPRSTTCRWCSRGRTTGRLSLSRRATTAWCASSEWTWINCCSSSSSSSRLRRTNQISTTVPKKICRYVEVMDA